MVAVIRPVHKKQREIMMMIIKAKKNVIHSFYFHSLAHECNHLPCLARWRRKSAIRKLEKCRHHHSIGRDCAEQERHKCDCEGTKRSLQNIEKSANCFEIGINYPARRN